MKLPSLQSCGGVTTNTSFCIRNISKTKNKPAKKKYRMMFFYSIENGTQNFRHFCRKKKENHSRLLLSMVFALTPSIIIRCTFMFLVSACLQAILVDSLMTIETQSSDQSVAQQLTTTTTHESLGDPLESL